MAAHTRKAIVVDSAYIRAAVDACLQAGIHNPAAIPEAIKALQNIQAALARWRDEEPRRRKSCPEEAKDNIVDTELEALGCADHDDALNGRRQQSQ